MWKKSLDPSLLLAKKVSLPHPCSVMHPFKIAPHLLPRRASFVMCLTTASPGGTHTHNPRPTLHSPSPAAAFRVLFPDYSLRGSNSGAGRWGGWRSLLLCNDLRVPSAGLPLLLTILLLIITIIVLLLAPRRPPRPPLPSPAQSRPRPPFRGSAFPSRRHQRAGAGPAHRAAGSAGRSARPVSMAPAEGAGASAPPPF